MITRSKARIKELLDTYDWREAINFASWSVEDVRCIVAMDEGENEASNWLLVVQLTNGQYSFLSAGCDYTGWDCRSWGHSTERETLAGLIRFGMGEEDRDRLQLPLRRNK